MALVRVAQPARLGQDALEHGAELARCSLMRRSTSAIAVCSASAASRSLNSLALPMAIAACSAKALRMLPVARVERAHLRAVHAQHAVQLAVDAQGHRQHAAHVRQRRVDG